MNTDWKYVANEIPNVNVHNFNFVPENTKYFASYSPVEHEYKITIAIHLYGKYRMILTSVSSYNNIAFMYHIVCGEVHCKNF